VIEGVAEKVPQRLKYLVNIDGEVPSNGRSFLEIVDDHHPQFSVVLHQIVRDEGEGWLIPPSERFRMFVFPEKNALFGVTNDQDIKWMRPRLTPHPISTFEQTLYLTHPEAAELPRTYIWCSILDSKKIAERPFLPPNWSLVELETGHDAMITEPHKLSKILLELA